MIVTDVTDEVVDRSAMQWRRIWLKGGGQETTSSEAE